jgi:TP901 family phage tail tape measure protein
MDDPAELAAIERRIAAASIEYGRTFEQVAALVAEAGAGGISKADLPEFLRLTMSAATAWGASADVAAGALAKIRASTQWGNKELEDFGDKVNALSDAGSAKEMDVVDMFQRAGAAAKAAGVDFDTSLAFLTAMNNVAIAPEVAARGFGAFSSKLRTANSLSKKGKAGLKMLGLTPDKVEKGMKTNAAKTMIDLLERLEKSPDKANAAKSIFGDEWWDDIARAGQALPEIRKNLAIISDPGRWRGSMAKNLNIELSTTATHLERLKSLSSEVGNRMGRWALPPINAAIERIIAGLNELDARAEAKSAETAAETAMADKILKGSPLSRSERERLVADRELANRVNAKVANTTNVADAFATEQRSSAARSVERSREERRRLQARQLEGDIAALERQGKLSDTDATRLGLLKRQRAGMGVTDSSPLDDVRQRPANTSEGARAAREAANEVLAHLERLRSRIAAMDQLAMEAASAADKRAYQLDAHAERQKLARSRSPNAAAAGRFGFGPGGAPGGGAMPATGSGLSMFGLGKDVSGWAKRARSAFEVDLGEAGMSIADRMAAGLTGGEGKVTSAAAQLSDGVTSRLAQADGAEAGRQVAQTFADGLRSGEGAAVAAAQALASKVRGALSGAGAGTQTAAAVRSRVSGALNDGVA